MSERTQGLARQLRTLFQQGARGNTGPHYSPIERNLPALTAQENRWVQNFAGLVGCWATPPYPGHTCQTEAGACNCAAIGVSP